MNNNTYFKISSSGQEDCFSTSHFKTVHEIIALLDKAVTACTDNAPMKDYLRDRIVGCTPISLQEWSAKHQDYLNAVFPIRFADIDYDREVATFTEWNGKDGVIISAPIYRLTGCYEMALSERGFDADCFIANLLCHCSVQRIDASNNLTFGFAGM